MAKRLVLMHGAPGSGKSTFIKKLGLEYITISPDTIRLLFSEPQVMEVDHHSCMQFSRKYDKEVWELIFKALEERMKNGSDTVIDACNFTQDFIERRMTGAEGRLFRRYRDGEAAYSGQLEDYAVYALALLTLDGVTLRPSFLSLALRRAREMRHFCEDGDRGGYFLMRLIQLI